MDLDLGLPRFDDDDPFLPQAEPFPTMAPPGAGSPRASQQHPQTSESSESIEAPLQRKRRAPKELPSDERQELRNADLAGWRDNYAANMAEASVTRNANKAASLARKNAEFWVMGAGIGGVGARLGGSTLKNPLDMFAGDAIMEALTGINASTAGQKRARDEEANEGSDSEARRMRPREDEEDQVGRGEGLIFQDDDNMVIDPFDVGNAHAVYDT